MASEVLRKKAREREKLIDQKYGADAYGGSNWKKSRDEELDDDKTQNTSGGTTAAGSSGKASNALRQKAAERTAYVDKQHGADAYGGSNWKSERNAAQNSTKPSQDNDRNETQVTNEPTTGANRETVSDQLKKLKSRQLELQRLITGAQRGGLTNEANRFKAESDKNLAEMTHLSKELETLEAARPVYTNELAQQKLDAVTSAESALKQTRASGMDIETEIQRRGDRLKNLDSNVQKLGQAYQANPTEENYNRYMTAAQQLEQAAKGYEALYKEYTDLFGGYQTAYDDYSAYMKDAKSDASGWEIAGRTAMAGIGSIARGIGATVDFLLPAELWGEKDPLSRSINSQAEEAKYLNEKWQESIYGRSGLVKGASMVGKATVEAIPNAILAMMSGGTSVAAQGTAALSTAATGTGIVSSIGTVANQMVRNPMYWSSVVQTLGPTYEEAKENGANEWQASATAIISSALNAGVEVSGGIELLPAKLKGGNTSDILQWVLSTPEEGVEEVIQRFVSGTVDKAIYDHDKAAFSTTDPDAIVNPGEMGKEFAMGTAVGGILGGVQVGGISAANAITNRKLGKIGSDYQMSAEELIKEGLSFSPESEAYQTAQEVKTKMDTGETVTDADLGRVVVANERTMQAEEKLAQANTPVQSLEEAAREAVQAESEVSGEGDTTPTQNEKPATEPLSAKESVPYNVMSTSNPVRQAVVAKQEATKKQLGYGEEGVKLFNEIAQNSRMSKTELMVRFDTPYQAGLTGLEMKDANLVNDFQIKAFNAGRLDHIARQAKDAEHTPGKILSESESGFDHTGAPKSLTQAEKDFSVWFNKKLGVKGSWDGKDGKAEYNAFFDSRTGGVSFAQDFGIDPELMEKLGSEDFMSKVDKLEAERDGSFVFYLAHEVADHVATNRAPEAMRAFNHAMYNYKQGLTAGENLARSKQAFYASKKVALDTEGAIEEVGADSILDLYDGDANKFMDAMRRVYDSLDENGKKGVRTYLDCLKDAIAKLKAWVRKLTGRENAEVKANVEKGITELEQLRDMFEQAIAASMQAVKEARKNPAKQTTPAVGEIKNSIKGVATAAGIDASRDANGKVVFKVDGKVVTRITPAHIQKKSGLGGLITTAMDNGFISGAEAEIQYKAAADIMNMIINTQDPEMVWAWVGSSMFSAIKSNADGQYGTTVDFTTVCRKTQDMITAMSKAMMKLQRGLTKDEVTKLQAELIAEGSSVPCPVCYVFSRWAGIGSVLDNMHRWQEKYDGYTDAQLNRQIAELTAKLGKGKAKDLAKMLREQDEEYDNLSFEKEKLALEKKQLTSKKKAAVKNNDARTLVDINNRLAEIDKRNPQINKRLQAIKASVAPELAWLMQVRAQPDYAEHGKVRANVLFNLDDAATFAEEFPLAWKYRTSRGPSAGKAILPYSDMRLGDIILGVDHTSADGNKLFANATGTFTDEQKAAVEKAIKRAKAQNLIGGQRFQSTSDFRYDYALDYLMAFWELQAIGSKMQTYTKIVEFGDMVAAVGGDFNLSVMPRNKGYITLPNGKNQLVFSSVTGIDFEAAKRSSQMHDNGQLILVGINDQHILAALEDSEETRGAHIGFVIPYHASGASINEFIRVLVSNLGETYQSKSYQDYSDVQSDKERKNATANQKRRNDLRTKLLRGKDGGKNWEPSVDDLAFIHGESKSIEGRSFAELREIERKALRGDKAAIAEYESWTAGALWDLYNKMWVEGGAEYGVRLNTAQAKSVMPHEYWNKTVNRDQAYINGFLFRSYCYNLGLVPRFTGAVVKGEKHGDFSDSKGYWKTLIDRPMYRNDGTYRAQQPVNMSTFNMEMLKPDYAKQNWEGYAVQEPDVQKATRAAERFVESSENMRQYSMKVTDKKLLNSLNAEIAKGEYDPVKNPNGGYIKVYRSFQVIDGKLYAPMNAVDRDADGKNRRLGYNSQYKVWEMATESPEIAQRYMDTHPGERYAKFNLDGVDNATSGVAYNPYLHASNLVLNDQFSAAYRRNLITAECWVPVSEIGAYKAQYAKDATGWVDWKPGGVAGKLMKIKPQYARKLFVSRYMLPVRKLESDEVAAMYKEYLDGTDIKVPWNVVTPDLRRELVKAGVPLDYKDVNAGKKDGKPNIIRFEDVFPDEKSANQTGRAVESDGTMRYSMKEGAANEREAEIHRGMGTYPGRDLPGDSRSGKKAESQRSGGREVRYENLTVYEQRKVNEILINAIDVDPLWRGFIRKLSADEVAKHILDGYADGERYIVDMQQQIPGFGEALDKVIAFVNIGKTSGDSRMDVGSTAPSGQHDSTGNELTVAQVEFFEDSKARDAEGNLLTLYHGSRTELFTVFDLYEGVWLTPDQRYAEVYAEQWHSWRDGDADPSRPEAKVYADPDYRVYAMYANITKPLDLGELDVPLSSGKVRQLARAMGASYADVKSVADDYMEEFTYMLTRSHDFIELAKKYKFDGFKATEKGRETWCAIKSEDQVKLTTNKAPTSNRDIQFSLKDSNGRKLSEGQQEYFKDSKARDENGDLLVMYHGTSRSGFNVFDTYGSNFGLFGQGSYFTDNRSVAESYQEKGKGKNPGVYEVYLNIKEPLDMDKVADIERWRQAFRDSDLDESYLDGVNTNEDAFRALKQNLADDMYYREEAIELVTDLILGMGYDGITHIGGGRYGSKDGPRHRVYIAFDAEQIKRTDNLNPTDNPDIRRSLKGEKAMRKEIERIRTEGAKAGKSEAEIEDDIMVVVGPEYGELIKTYGEIKRGERPAREIDVPRKTEEGRNVSQTIRTVLEAEATPDASVPTIQQLIAQGDFSYDVITDKAAMEGAKKLIRTKGYETVLAKWVSDVKDGKVSKANTAIGWELYNAAANAGDLSTAMTILDGMIKHQRNAAQAVQATRILKKLSPDAQLYGVKRSVDDLQEDLVKKYGEKAPDLEIDEGLARKLLEAKTDEERDEAMTELYKDIGRQIPPSFVDKWNAWRYLAMLGNPRTHVRNVVGNLGFMLPVAAKDLAATTIEASVSFVSRGKMGRTKAIPSRELLKAAWDDYANVADEISGSGKYNDSAMKNQAIEDGRVIFKTKILEKARKANSAALEMEDMWFAKPHYAFALAQYCKAHGVTADQLRRGKALGNARAYAIKEAQKATYRDTNDFSEFVGKLGRYHGDNAVMKGASVVMEGILPFRKTPANILMRGLEYSPMGLLKGLTLDMVKVKKGDITAAEAIDNVAAGLTGTGLLGLGIYLAAQGLIRGAGGDDEDEKKFEEMQGHQAYALELPDGTSATLDWLAPEALPVFVGVNLYEMARDNKGKSNLADILTAVSNVTEPMLEMSCLQSLNDLFDSVAYAKNDGLSALPTILASAATSYLTQAFPTILGQAERSTQDVRMTTYTEKDNFLTSDMQYTLGKISAKFPGWDYQQIPYIDAWGRTESAGSPAENAANNFLNPAYMSQIETSAMEEELQRLYDATGESSVLPDRASKYFTVDKERKDLTADEYVEYATERGQMAYDLLSDITSRPEYRSASDEDKADLVEMAYEYATAVAKTKVSDYKPTGWVKTAIEAEKKTGMDETEYMLYKLALSTVDQPNKSGEYGGDPTQAEKAAAIASRQGMSDKDIAYLWDTKDAYALLDAGVDMRSYVEYVGNGGSVNAEKLIDLRSKGIEEETYYDFLDKLKEVDQPTESGKMGSYTQDEARAAVKAIPGLTRKERAALWQSVDKNWSAKKNPWR